MRMTPINHRSYFDQNQNCRTDYITAFWNVVNWKEVDLISENLCRTSR